MAIANPLPQGAGPPQTLPRDMSTLSYQSHRFRPILDIANPPQLFWGGSISFSQGNQTSVAIWFYRLKSKNDEKIIVLYSQAKTTPIKLWLFE